MRRGVTLVELLAVLAITVFLTLAGGQALIAGMGIESRLRDGATSAERVNEFESAIDGLISRAYLSTDLNDTSSTFIGSNGPIDGVAPGQGVSTNSTLGSLADELVFSTVGSKVSDRYAASTGTFEELNSQFGPQGGKAECDLSLRPYDAPGNESGLFLRVQRPADGDPTQGGRQSVLNKDVTKVSFEFYDGLDWQPEWDTRTMGIKRLPAAVRVTYRLDGEDSDRVLIVRLPHSDATPTNPVTVGGGA
ncbi:MAG: hypothetical protein JSS66_14170 [Armatimonadetes bacterium]|nr:hypothetical protein [Armatimonadota bacterium]